MSFTAICPEKPTFLRALSIDTKTSTAVARTLCSNIFAYVFLFHCVFLFSPVFVFLCVFVFHCVFLFPSVFVFPCVFVCTVGSTGGNRLPDRPQASASHAYLIVNICQRHNSHNSKMEHSKYRQPQVWYTHFFSVVVIIAFNIATSELRGRHPDAKN